MDEKSIFLGMGFSELITLISLAIAFVALFVAPFVNLRNSKRQVIAPMRQAWINSLREKTSEFISIVCIERLLVENGKPDQDRYQRLQLLKTSIELHINAGEDDHIELVRQLSSIIKDYHDCIFTGEKNKTLIKLCQNILSDEWKATKKT